VGKEQKERLSDRRPKKEKKDGREKFRVVEAATKDVPKGKGDRGDIGEKQKKMAQAE